MGYFTINLPNYKKADVRYGPVKKMKTLSHRFRRKNFEAEQPAYIVKVDVGLVNERIYYLLKTKDGCWLDELQSDVSSVIKSKIDEYEQRLTVYKTGQA
jgi:hypothetical protein